MKISYNWLKKYIQLNETAEEIAERLTKAGLEVEDLKVFETIPGGLEGLVIGKVLTCDKHPGADKLKLTTVSIGNNTILPVVCGAANVAAGQKIILATVGSTIYPAGKEPIKITKAKIRGEVSEGMICAEDEIGLGTSHDGIIVLNTDLPEGTPASTIFKIEKDYIFEIGLTPNRADAASHLGVARDLRALLERPVTLPEITLPSSTEKNPIEVKIENHKACHRYSGLVIKNLTVKESPDWLKQKLKSIGLSPINNVVDATNYILHDLGQPLHAFDLQKVSGNKIIVKTVKAGTPFVTLDGITRKLGQDDLMICNEYEPMCIAGVFGGLESGVSESTKDIFLESAYFSPDYIRKTSQLHGLKTDASFRFERGTDPNMPVYALKKAAALLIEISGGRISSDIIDIYPEKIKDFQVKTSCSYISGLIGKKLDRKTITTILSNLEINVSGEGDELLLSVPPFKVDVQRPADIVEEVLRIYGYDNIELPARIKTDFVAEFPVKDKASIISKIGNILSGAGFSEIITNSLTKESYLKLNQRPGDAVSILNKLSEDLGVMRQSLLLSGLDVIAYNINRRQKDLKLFETGKVYFKLDNQYKEKEYLAVYITGNKADETWRQKNTSVDFFDLKTIVHKILQKTGITKIKTSTIDGWLFSEGITYEANKQQLVKFGRINQKFVKAADIKQEVYYAEFDLELLLELSQNQLLFKEISKFPEVRRDLSLVLDKSVTFEAISKVALEKERKLLKEINVFDVYEGENIGKDKKSYSVSFILQDYEKTLTDKVIDSTMQKLMDSFEKELGAIIRK
ncbi:MAG: phenylalanine--tRNA ligase subunit beta [Cytophagaceae bacterium]